MERSPLGRNWGVQGRGDFNVFLASFPTPHTTGWVQSPSQFPLLAPVEPTLHQSVKIYPTVLCHWISGTSRTMTVSPLPSIVTGLASGLITLLSESNVHMPFGFLALQE